MKKVLCWLLVVLMTSLMASAVAMGKAEDPYSIINYVDGATVGKEGSEPEVVGRLENLAIIKGHNDQLIFYEKLVVGLFENDKFPCEFVSINGLEKIEYGKSIMFSADGREFSKVFLVHFQGASPLYLWAGEDLEYVGCRLDCKEDFLLPYVFYSSEEEGGFKVLEPGETVSLKPGTLAEEAEDSKELKFTGEGWITMFPKFEFVSPEAKEEFREYLLSLGIEVPEETIDS